MREVLEEKLKGLKFDKIDDTTFLKREKRGYETSVSLEFKGDNLTRKVINSKRLGTEISFDGGYEYEGGKLVRARESISDLRLEYDISYHPNKFVQEITLTIKGENGELRQTQTAKYNVFGGITSFDLIDIIDPSKSRTKRYEYIESGGVMDRKVSDSETSEMKHNHLLHKTPINHRAVIEHIALAFHGHYALKYKFQGQNNLLPDNESQYGCFDYNGDGPASMHGLGGTEEVIIRDGKPYRFRDLKSFKSDVEN